MATVGVVVDAPLVNNRASTPSYNYHKASPVLFCSLSSTGTENDSPTTSVSQESEQEAESGDVNQSFTVTSSGDNSNQSAAVQGAANTGNSQSQTSVVQSGSEAEDIELEGGSSIEVSPELESQSQQAVEQAAAAAE